jgi:two-component system sensor histidine kinase/response regulator
VIEDSAKVDEVIDLPGLMSNLEGNRQLLREVIALFLDCCPKHIAQIELALSNGDNQILWRESHTLKGAIGSLHAPRAYRIVSSLEQSARSGDIAGVRQALADLEPSVEQLIARLREIG